MWKQKYVKRKYAKKYRKTYSGPRQLFSGGKVKDKSTFLNLSLTAVPAVNGVAGGFVNLSASGTNLGFGISFQLSDCVDATQFANCFDQYRINWIQLNFKAVRNFNNSGTGHLGYFAIAVDYDNAATPSSESIVLGYNNSQRYSGYEDVNIKFKPRCQLAIQGGSQNAQGKVGQWCDCATASNAGHYGLRGYITAPQIALTTPYTMYKLYATYGMSFKNVI